MLLFKKGFNLFILIEKGREGEREEEKPHVWLDICFKILKDSLINLLALEHP